MKTNLYLLLCSLIGCGISAFAQPPVSGPFQTTIFVHTSKPYYIPGEKIWLSAYLLNASTQQLLAQNHPLYVQLYAPDGKLLTNQIIATEAGCGSASVALLPTTPPGVYRLRAFTQSMLVAKQAHCEALIYVGVAPKAPRPPKGAFDLKASELVKIVADSATYSRRSPVQIRLSADPNLKATLSVSVYQETAFTAGRGFVLPAKTLNREAKEPDEALFYMGRLLRANGHAIANGQVILQINLPEGQKVFTANADSVGFFVFKDLIFEGEQTAYWQVNNAKGRVITDAHIHWVQFPRIPHKIDSLVMVKENVQVVQSSAVFLSDGDSLALDSKLLEEVSIKAKKIETPMYLQAMLHKEKDVSFAINFDNNQLPNDAEGINFHRMLSMLPACGTRDPPVYLIDGIKLFANGQPNQMIDNRQIKRIELLRGASGNIYGSTCVYAIYTYGVESKSSKNNTPARIVTLNSYQATKPFYNPNYDNKIPQEQDNRQTLYWNPTLEISPKQGEILLRFFTSDVSGTYRVIVQGMSNAGSIYAETFFEVKD